MNPAVTTNEIFQYLQQHRAYGEGYGKQNKRGINVYSLSDLVGVTGQTKSGAMVRGEYQRPLYQLGVWERVEIFKRSSPIFGLVTSRMHRISGLDWNVVAHKKVEDRIATKLKSLKAVSDEYEDVPGLGAGVLRQRIYGVLKQYLKELKPDLSNFNGALLRWSRRIKEGYEDRSTEIEGWLERPNPKDNFTEFLKKWIFDMLVHGGSDMYKKHDGERLQSVYMLPGGTVYPLRGVTVESLEAYAQVTEGYIPQIYYGDEIVHATYVPTSFQSHGMVPLEALVNKLAEILLFEQLSAQQADGTKPPEQLVLLHEQAPFGDMDKDLQVPVDKAEQEKTEQLLNEAREGAIRVLSGMGSNTTVLDLTRKDTFDYYMRHEEQIRSDIALAFNMSNMEVNLTGSSDTSGRATSDSEMEIDQQRGLFPLVQTFMEKMNQEVLPFRFGSGYELEFASGMSEDQDLNMLLKKVQSKLWSTNELRTERGLDPKQGEEYDNPPAPQSADQQQGQAEENPLFTRQA